MGIIRLHFGCTQLIDLFRQQTDRCDLPVDTTIPIKAMCCITKMMAIVHLKVTGRTQFLTSELEQSKMLNFDNNFDNNVRGTVILLAKPKIHSY